MRAINANGWEVAMNKSAASFQPSKPETLQYGAGGRGEVRRMCLVYDRGCWMLYLQTQEACGPSPCCRGVGLWISPPGPMQKPLPKATPERQ